MCRCWDCRRRKGLTAIAPRLARAARQIVEIERARRGRYAHATDRLLEAERLVAHRELQLLRAGAVNDPRYVKRRGDKLDRARRVANYWRGRVEDEAA